MSIKQLKIDSLLIAIGIFTHRFELLFLAIVILRLLIRSKSVRFSLRLNGILLAAFLVECFIIYLNNYTFGFFLRQFLVIYTYVNCYDLFFRNYVLSSKEYKVIFKSYLQVAFVVALLGLLQFIVFKVTSVNIFSFINTMPLTEFGIARISSITTEPGNLSVLLLPVLVYDIINLKTLNYFKSIIVLTAFLLTFSSASFFVFGLFLLYMIFRRINLKWSLLMVVSFLISMQSFSLRADEMSNLFAKITIVLENLNKLDIDYFEDTNGSSYATLLNLSASVKAPSRLVGTGLGTNEQSVKQVYPHLSDETELKCVKSAYSQGIRIFSEFGFLGLLIWISFVITLILKKSPFALPLLIVLVSMFIRGGNFILYGSIFFYFMSYYVKRCNLNYRKC